MNWNEKLVTIAVDPDRIVVVLVLTTCWGELNVDFLCHTCGNHSFLIVSYFEVTGRRRQDVEPLRLWGVIDESQFHRVRLVRFETCKLDHVRWGAEYAIRAHSIVLIFLSYWIAFVRFVFSKETSLQFNLCLSVGCHGIWVSSASIVFTIYSTVKACVWWWPFRLKNLMRLAEFRIDLWVALSYTFTHVHGLHFTSILFDCLVLSLGHLLSFVLEIYN